MMNEFSLRISISGLSFQCGISICFFTNSGRTCTGLGSHGELDTTSRVDASGLMVHFNSQCLEIVHECGTRRTRYQEGLHRIDVDVLIDGPG